MKVTVKSITEVHSLNDKGEVRHQGVGDERAPIVDRLDIELVDADGNHVATIGSPPYIEHGLEVGAEYDNVHNHVFEHAPAKK